jgi:hypothetical protein
LLRALEPAFGSGTLRQSGKRPRESSSQKIVIPKAGKSDYSKVCAYRVFYQLDVIKQLVERTAGYPIADRLERKKGVHEGQYGCRKQ